MSHMSAGEWRSARLLLPQHMHADLTDYGHNKHW